MAVGGMLTPARSRATRAGLGARLVVVGVAVAAALAGCSHAQGEGVAAGSTSKAAADQPSSAASTGTAPSASVTPSSQPILKARRTGSVASERPASVRLPSGRTIPVEAVSSKADGSLDVPVDIDHAGWFRGGSAIGDPFGSTLLAAHIDSFTQGLGPFEELLSVRAGQRVTVTGGSLRETFRIDSLRLIPQGSLRHDQWIYSPTGQRRLTLVTCAPPYDRGRGGYQNLAVVTALPVGDVQTKKD